MFPRPGRLTVATSVLLLTCAAVSASPRNALADATPTATASPAPTATATATATPTPATRLGNIATRSLIDAGDNGLIAGFIITGSQSKKVIVRGIGPSLNLPGQLNDPTLELRDGNGAVIKSNDNWRDSSDKDAIFNTQLSPQHDSESAVIATLAAKGAAYTAILHGVNGSTGIGVVEVYDVDPKTADSKLANISTRGLVLRGDNVMIAGTIVVGPEKQGLIIRALGPSLSVVNKLTDPKLELRGANGQLLRSNDNWEKDDSGTPNPDRQAFFDNGLAPTDPRESAILWTPPTNDSNYTAIVRDAAEPSNEGSVTPAPTVTRTQHGSGNTVEIQRVQFARAPVGGVFRLTFTLPSVIMSGQPGDKAALWDTITVPWNATADDIKAAILASSNFYKYDQNNHLTDGPKSFDKLFGSGGGLDITGNEGFRREPVITRSASDLSVFTIQFGTLTTGSVGVRNPWISGLPFIEVDHSSIIYDGGIAVVEIYALEPSGP